MRYYAYTIMLSQPSISLEHANIVAQIYIHLYRTHIRSFKQYHRRPPTASPSPWLGVRTLPKTPIAIISGTGKATNFKFGQNINRVHPNKSVGVSRDCPNCLGTPIMSGTEKATDFKFSQYIQRIHPNKSPWKVLEKRNRRRIQGLPSFFGYPLYLRNGYSYGFQILHAH